MLKAWGPGGQNDHFPHDGLSLTVLSKNVTDNNDGPTAGNEMFASTSVLSEAVGTCTDIGIEG